MHDQDLAIVKGLVSVAWADGRMAGEERELLEGVLQAFRATPSEVKEIRAYAEKPRTIEDIPINDLSHDDRRILLQHAVLVAYADGEEDGKERAMLDELCKRLRIPDVEARGIVDAAIRRVKEAR
jgi:tellurite resistance protein